MAFSKIILNGVTQIDLTQDTTQADKTIQGYTGHQNDGTGFTGSYVPPTDFLVTLSLDTNTVQWVADKTYAQIKAAYDSGQTIKVEAIRDGDLELADGRYYDGEGLWYRVSWYDYSGLIDDDDYFYYFDDYFLDENGLQIERQGYRDAPPKFTITYSGDQIISSTCSMGYYEIIHYNTGGPPWDIALVSTGQQDSNPIVLPAVLMGTTSGGVKYTSVSGTYPDSDITFYSNGNITVTKPSIYNQTLNVTSNGTYFPTNEGVFTRVDVAVPTPTPTLQSKTATPTESTQTVTADSGYDGLNQVTVNPIPSEYIIPTGTKSITANGTGIDVAAYATVDVNVPSSGGSIVISDTLDSNGGIIKTITTTGETVTLQSKTVTPSSVQQTITPDSGYTGLSEVIVNGNNELLYKALIERKVTGAVVATGIEDISSQSLSNLPTSVTSIRFPDLINVRGSYAVANSKGITVAVFEKPLTITSSELLYKCTKLTTVDMNLGTKLGSNYAFEGDSLLTTLILRNTTLYGLNALNHFNGTPFANGGSGGTIYIPKVLYDHLGDGSSSDYQAATNWSALYGYGTVTWAQIEGSQYENYYADGTPIS